MNYALLLAGGTGTRLKSDIPKQYVKLNGKMLITYSLEVLMQSPWIDYVIIAADPGWRNAITADIGKSGLKAVECIGFSSPGANRQSSILNGLQWILAQNHARPDWDKAGLGHRVLIHDAARPCITQKLIADCFSALKGHDGVLPVLPMKDTVYLSRDGKKIMDLIDRSEVYAGQAPEAFDFRKYYEANKRLLPDRILKINGSTEPAVLSGLDIAMIPGDENNFKITTNEDLERFRLMVEACPGGKECKADEGMGII